MKRGIHSSVLCRRDDLADLDCSPVLSLCLLLQLFASTCVDVCRPQPLTHSDPHALPSSPPLLVSFLRGRHGCRLTSRWRTLHHPCPISPQTMTKQQMVAASRRSQPQSFYDAGANGGGWRFQTRRSVARSLCRSRVSFSKKAVPRSTPRHTVRGPHRRRGIPPP